MVERRVPPPPSALFFLAQPAFGWLREEKSTRLSAGCISVPAIEAASYGGKCLLHNPGL